MNTKGIKFLAVLAVLAMAFAAFAIVIPSEKSDATSVTVVGDLTETTTEVTTDGNYYLKITDAKSLTFNKEGGTFNIYIYAASGNDKAFTPTITAGTVNLYLVTESAYATTLTVVDGLKVQATTAKAYTADTVAKSITSDNDDSANSDFGVLYTHSSEYTYYATGTLADITLASGETALVKNAITTVKNASSSTNAGALKFTGLTSEAGITLTGSETTMTVTGTVLSGNTNFITVSGIIKVANGDFTFADASVPSINAIGGAFSSNKFSENADLWGADHTADLSAASYVYNNIDATFTASGANSITLINSTGTITVLDTAGKSIQLSMNTTEFNGTLTPTATADSGAIAITSMEELVLKQGEFTTATTSITGDLNIAANATLTTSAELTMTGDLIVRGTLELGAKFNLTGNGSIYGKIEDTSKAGKTISVSAAGTETAQAVVFKAYDGSSLIYVSVEKGTNPTNVTIDLSGATSTVYLHGTISQSMTYGQTQNVVIDGYLEIKDNATITIKGGFEILDDVRMVITNGTVVVEGAGVDVVIDGDLDIDTNGTFTVENTAKSVKINGTVENGGTMEIKTTDVVITKGGSMFIVDTSKETKLGAITVATGGFLQIGGPIAGTSITNSGSVVFNGAILTDDITIIMNGDGASVDIVSVTNEKTVTNNTQPTATITVSDETMTIPTEYTQTYKNKITVETGDVAKTGFSGIEIVQKVTTNTTKKTVTSGFTVSGNFGVVGDSAPAVKMTLGTENVKSNFAFADGFTIGPNTEVVVNYLTEVNNSMYVVSTATAQAKLSGYLDVNGVIACNANSVVGDTNFSAARFTVGTGTDAITYYASIENAVEILEDYTESIALTILGTNLDVNSSVTIPANISLKGDGTFTIGSDADNTVVMYVTNGSSIASGLSIIVKGTLYLENAKDLKTTKITADVKTTDGTDLSYTNLYTALSLAEAGDKIEVTADELNIIRSIVIPEDVTLYIPAGVNASVKVANKVTITVNGILMTDGIKADDWGTTVSTTAAVLNVNGVFMTSESNDVAKVYENYETAGAYYFISDDIGDYVYISHLCVGALTDAKEFTIYGNVTETEAVELEKQNVTIAAGAELTASSITLKESSIVTSFDEEGNYGELTALVYGADGVSSLAVTDFVFGEIEDEYDTTDKVNELSVSNIGGTVVILTGTVFSSGLNLTADDESTFTVMAGAIFYIPQGAGVMLGSSAAILGDVVVAGDLIIGSEDVVVTGDITVLADAETGLKATLTVSQMTFVSGIITIYDGATFNLAGTITAGVEPTELGAAATIVGNVTTDYAIIAYPGTSMEGMTINGKEPVSTEFYINDELFMTAYSAANKVYVKDIIDKPAYDLEDLDPTALKALKTTAKWGATDSTKVGDYVALYADVELATVYITTSWVNGLALYIDGARVMSDSTPLKVGIYTVSASINAGYACDNMTITFNGIAVPITKEGAIITITVEDEGSVLAVSGDVYIPEPEPVTPEEKSEWTVTTILLVILVILIAIMAVIVALRLNRS